MHEDNKANGFAVLAFPCNQFGAQEPGSNKQIQEFATSKYDATFPLFEKTDVNGADACELYQYLKTAALDEAGAEDIPWNFTKFLVDRQGNAVARFGPKTTPEEISAQLGNWL